MRTSTPVHRRAEEWDLANPLFTGALRVFQIDTKLKVVIYSYIDPTTILLSSDNLNVFAECHIGKIANICGVSDFR